MWLCHTELAELHPGTPHVTATLGIMQPSPIVVVIVVATATAAGAVLGWWALSLWARRSMRSPRMPERTVRASSAAGAAIAWGLIAFRFADPTGLPVLPALLAFAACAAVLAVVDISEQRLPNTVILCTLGATAVLLVIASALTAQWMPLLWAVVGAAGMFGLYLALALVAPRSIGMGDVKLAAPIGMLLGWFGLSAWLVGLVGGVVVGGLVAVVALASRRVGLRSMVPFGPSMLVGAVIALLLLG
jgi:Type II secretory pathway, prepilin signal peptidase PulO and related peptidases